MNRSMRFFRKFTVCLVFDHVNYHYGTQIKRVNPVISTFFKFNCSKWNANERKRIPEFIFLLSLVL